jgi:cobalt-zinc-cadmium resistance protein CzcA
MMVDGAVVMVENAFRLLSHARESGRPINRTHVMLEAAREVINPIAFAILIIIVVFLPLFSLTGLEGKLFKPMALTITFAMVGSLLLSLTLVPVLAALILKPKEEKDTFLVRWAKKLYLPLLDWALDRKKKVIGAGGRTAGRSLALFPFLGKEFMPTLQEGAIMFRVTGIPSTSLDESMRVPTSWTPAAQEVSAGEVGARHHRPRRKGRDRRRQLHGSPAGHEAARTSGRRSSPCPALGREMQEFLEGEVPTVVFGATQPIQMRVEELISGVRATLALKIYGEDLTSSTELSGEDQDRARRRARRGRPVGRGQQGQAADGHQGRSRGRGALRHERRRHPGRGAGRHRRRGGQHADRRHASASTSRCGCPRSSATVRRRSRRSRSAPVRRRDRAFLQVAKIELDEGYTFVRREQLQRYAVLQMDVQGRDVDSFVKDANAANPAKVKLPTGYWVEWGGAFENQQRAMERLAVIVPLTIGLIFILLYTAFNSVRHATLIIANVPFAIIGGIVGLFITGQYLSVPSAIGFIAVFGVAMLNGIVLVSFLNDQRNTACRSATRCARAPRCGCGRC